MGDGQRATGDGAFVSRKKENAIVTFFISRLSLCAGNNCRFRSCFAVAVLIELEHVGALPCPSCYLHRVNDHYLFSCAQAPIPDLQLVRSSELVLLLLYSAVVAFPPNPSPPSASARPSFEGI